LQAWLGHKNIQHTVRDETVTVASRVQYSSPAIDHWLSFFPSPARGRVGEQGAVGDLR
jgi:hypothetical protein